MATREVEPFSFISFLFKKFLNVFFFFFFFSKCARYIAAIEEDKAPHDLIIPDPKFRRNYNVDREALKKLFDEHDLDKSGSIGLDEFEKMLAALGVAPMKDPTKRVSASSDKIKTS